MAKNWTNWIGKGTKKLYIHIKLAIGMAWYHLWLNKKQWCIEASRCILDINGTYMYGINVLFRHCWCHWHDIMIAGALPLTDIFIYVYKYIANWYSSNHLPTFMICIQSCWGTSSYTHCHACIFMLQSSSSAMHSYRHMQAMYHYNQFLTNHILLLKSVIMA